VEYDRPPLAQVGVHPEHGLLRHRPAGHEHGRRLAQQRGDLALKRGDHAAVTVPVDLGIDTDRREQPGRGDLAVPGHELGTGRPNRGQVIVSSHDPNCAALHPSDRIRAGGIHAYGRAAG
jgi:hypothetical protein